MSQTVEGPDDPLAGPYAGESGNVLEDLNVYDTGPVVDDDGGGDGDPSGISGPAFFHHHSRGGSRFKIHLSYERPETLDQGRVSSSPI